jgi:hypothetical protein
VLLLSALFASTTATRAAGPAAPREEAAAVLQRFVGTWKTQAQLRRPGPPERETRTTGRGECRATLEGRWFEFRTETVPAGDAELQIMTYDAAAGLYRQWVFASDGYHHQADGRWDAATSTLRWTGKAGDASLVIDDHWVSPDRLEWTLLRSDAQGRVLQTIRGTLERVE